MAHSNDFLKKEPTKNEKMFAEIVMHLQDVDQRVWSMSSHVLAMGAVLNVDPKKMAEMLTGDDAKIRDYANKVNEEIKKIQDAQPKSESTDEHAGHDHSHHDHAGHDHSHDHSGHNH
jgi:hypothetical protein